MDQFETVIDYRLIVAVDAELAALVNTARGEDWFLWGAPYASASGQSCQAMVRHEGLP